MIKVSVGVDKKWLRLRWKEGDKYKILYPGCENNSEGLRTAKRIALQMEEDSEKGRFDHSLNKYKIQSVTKKQITLEDLCHQWIKSTKSHLDTRSIKTYNSRLNTLKKSGILELTPDKISENEAYDLISFLKSENLKVKTIKTYFFTLSATWDWAISNGFIERKNPFKIKFEVESKKIDPFSKQEIQEILKAAPTEHKIFIKFLFISGCRIGEGFGLRWDDLSADCLTVTIAHQWTNSRIKPLKKGGKPRTFSLPPAFALELQSLNRESDFVFGKPLRSEIFRRIWMKILKVAEVRYRKPYSCRHTFVCHRLQEGWKPTQIVQVTGHSLETMFAYYASYIAEEIHLPDL